jgi:hypothetical protein
LRKSRKIPTSTVPQGDFIVDGEAQMFDINGIQENFMGSPIRGKYAPVLHKYTLPPKKQRGVGGIDNGRSPRRTTGKKSQKNGAAATVAALAGVAVGGVLAYCGVTK